ncbi:Chromosome segregation in meiosis protein 3 [Madurella mycetomatis]|uniref:Chromosome segregation in meiosis protein n=1 Tax=Madurella mycetomatis TaxID=100816 RepID=A0A175VNW6_9PEZI|nr:Chromosome segregation in meiosis protein 3 [Madurella mycetomatis]
MSAKTDPKPADAVNRRTDGNAFINDYLADWGDNDDPFRSPSPEPAKKNDKNETQRKKTDVLGIEQQIDLKRKPRVPRVKLDDARLLSDKGIPKLRKMAPRLKLKGKGHEFSDAARLLSFYQEWLDDLFPKATFLDALAMVEKAGHKTTMRNARMQWIDESRPKATFEAEEEFPIYEASAPQQPGRIAPIFEKTAQDRAKTPAGDDLFGDDDIYNATPRASTSNAEPARQADHGVPDDDDLDALMAEAELGAGTQQAESGSSAAPFRSIFGNGSGNKAPQPTGVPDEDDLDALMAEVEAQSAPTKPNQPTATGSISGGGKLNNLAAQTNYGDGDDLDVLLAEAEAEAAKGSGSGSSGVQLARGNTTLDDEDDLDALMAMAEAGKQEDLEREYELEKEDEVRRELEVDDELFANSRTEEEAMVEMDGF